MITQKTVKLVNEMMQLEHKINQIHALNGNQDTSEVQQYRRFILAKTKRLKQGNSSL